MNIGRIVIAVDFTPGNAQQTAWVLRDLFPGAEPIFVHAVTRADDTHGDDTSPREATAIETACLGARVRIRELADALGIAGPRWTIRPGAAADVISAAALEWGAHLVVVGPHADRPWDWLGASTVERIVERTHLPVLIVQGWPTSLPRHVVVATASVEHLDRGVGAWMQLLYSRFRTRFHAIHSMTGVASVATLASSMPVVPLAPLASFGATGEHADPLADSYEDAVAAIGIPRTALTVEADWGMTPAATVLAAAERDASELIIVGQSHRGHIARALHGNITRHIIESAERPVLVVPTDDSIATRAGTRS